MQVVCFSCRVELRSVRDKSRLKRHKPSLLAEFLFEASTNCSSRMRSSSLNCQLRVAHRSDIDFPVSVGLSKHPTKEDSVQRLIDFIKSLCCGYGGNGNGISSFILQMLAIGRLIKWKSRSLISNDHVMLQIEMLHVSKSFKVIVQFVEEWWTVLKCFIAVPGDSRMERVLLLCQQRVHAPLEAQINSKHIIVYYTQQQMKKNLNDTNCFYHQF